MVFPVILVVVLLEALIIPSAATAPVVVPDPAIKGADEEPIVLLSIVKDARLVPVACSMATNTVLIAAVLPVIEIPAMVLPVPLVGPILTVLEVLVDAIP